MQLIQTRPKKSSRTTTKAWLKTLTLACSYAGLSGRKSLWDLADLALQVQTRWQNDPKYNLKELSNNQNLFR